MALTTVGQGFDNWPSGIQAGDIAIVVMTSWKVSGGSGDSTFSMTGFVKVTDYKQINPFNNAGYGQVWVYSSNTPTLAGSSGFQRGSVRASGLTGTESGTLPYTVGNSSLPDIYCVVLRGSTGNYVVNGDYYDAGQLNAGTANFSFSFATIESAGSYALAQMESNANGYGFGPMMTSVTITGQSSTISSTGSQGGSSSVNAYGSVTAVSASAGFDTSMSVSSSGSYFGAGYSVNEFPADSFDPFGVQGFFGS